MLTSRSNHQMHVTFDLGAQQYAIAACYVERITPMAALHCPAGMPKLLRGFLDLAGEPVPVVCLHSMFCLPVPEPGLWTPVIILRCREQRLAFSVDKVNRIVKVDGNTTLALPANHVFNECVEGLVRCNEGSFLVLSPDQLLLQKESETIAALQEMAAQRISELEGVEA